LEQKRILFADDDPEIREVLRLLLTCEGYDVLEASCGKEVMERMDHTVDLVILDVMMPEVNGYGVCAEIRKRYTVPILFLTAKGQDADKTLGFSAGGDDYLVKPFGTSELLARIRAAIRHTRTTLPSGQIAQSGKFISGDLTIDYDKHQVLIGGENAKLTVNEYKIVALLGKYAGKVMTYDFIIRELWGPKARTDNQILRVNMANIRRKIEENPGQPQYIFTEVGVGYRMREGD